MRGGCPEWRGGVGRMYGIESGIGAGDVFVRERTAG